MRPEVNAGSLLTWEHPCLAPPHPQQSQEPTSPPPKAELPYLLKWQCRWPSLLYCWLSVSNVRFQVVLASALWESTSQTLEPSVASGVLLSRAELTRPFPEKALANQALDMLMTPPPQPARAFSLYSIQDVSSRPVTSRPQS